MSSLSKADMDAVLADWSAAHPKLPGRSPQAAARDAYFRETAWMLVADRVLAGEVFSKGEREAILIGLRSQRPARARQAMVKLQSAKND